MKETLPPNEQKREYWQQRNEENVNYALYPIDQGMSRMDAAEKATRMTLYRKIQQKDN